MRDLKLKGQRITSDGIEHIGGLTELRALILDDTQIDDEGMKHLASLTNLERLYLFRTYIGNDGLEHLKGLSNLKLLRFASHIRQQYRPRASGRLDESYRFGSERDQRRKSGNEASRRAPKLAGVESLGNPSWAIPGVKSLSQMTELTWLNLNQTEVDDEGLASLAPLTNLTYLHLGNNHSITDAGLENLASLTNLKI